MRLPKVRESVMFGRRRAPQFYSAWYLLVVSCAADGSPSSPARAPRSPGHCAVGKLRGQSWDFHIVSPLQLASVVGKKKLGPPLEIVPKDTLSFFTACISFP